MINFGFSAYLKLLALNPKPRRSELIKRVLPSDNSPYDFHKRMRHIAKRFILEPGPKDITKRTHIKNAVNEITAIPERNSAESALKNLGKWAPKEENKFFKIDGGKYESAREIFSVKFTPEFGLTTDEGRYAVHLWNTQKPELNDRVVQAALSLFSSTLPKGIVPSVLCLQTGRFFILEETTETSTVGLLFSKTIEDTIIEIEKTSNPMERKDPNQPFSPPLD